MGASADGGGREGDCIWLVFLTSSQVMLRDRWESTCRSSALANSEGDSGWVGTTHKGLCHQTPVQPQGLWQQHHWCKGERGPSGPERWWYSLVSEKARHRHPARGGPLFFKHFTPFSASATQSRVSTPPPDTCLGSLAAWEPPSIQSGTADSCLRSQFPLRISLGNFCWEFGTFQQSFSLLACSFPGPLNLPNPLFSTRDP